MPNVTRATVSSSAQSWARDLCHPLPLAAVLVLALNDHLLKGSGLLPGWLTGKLSDVAGLFFFPLLLCALARGATRLAGRRDLDPSALAMSAVLATGAVFTAIKLYAPLNAWVAGVWGVMVMDVTDLFTLPVLALSAAFMVRRARGEGFVPARRFLDFGAVIAAALASAATSSPGPPPAVPAPPQPVPSAVAVAAPTPAACGTLALSVCERSSTGTFVVIEASGGGCELEIVRAEETSSVGSTAADALPARLRVEDRGPSTFSLSFLRTVDPGTQSHNVDVALEVRRVRGEEIDTQIERLARPCVAR